MARQQTALFAPEIVVPAFGSALRKLDPRAMMKNPVMFVVEVVALLTTVLFLRDVLTGADNLGFTFQIILWLWFTLLFANFAEAVAEGRGKAQADALRATRTTTPAKRLLHAEDHELWEGIAAEDLEPGDVVVADAGDVIPGDGEVIGRRLGQRGDDHRRERPGHPRVRRRPLGGDRRHHGHLRPAGDPHHLGARQLLPRPDDRADRGRRAAEDAERDRPQHPARRPDDHLRLRGRLDPELRRLRRRHDQRGGAVGAVRDADPDHDRRAAVGDRHRRHGPAGALQRARDVGRAVEAAGDVDTLLLDKTGTITLGNRQATEFMPVRGVSEAELADAAQLASLADETPEGRSIVVLAKEKHNLRERDMTALGATFVPFTAQTRMSGVDFGGSAIRKGAVDAVLAYAGVTLPARRAVGAPAPQPSAALPEAVREVQALAETIGKAGGTPLAVARDGRLLGVVALKDIVKGGTRERFAELRRMGIRTVMITGDNPMTAAAIAAEAGVDDFLAEATPEAKLALIREEQAKGKLVAMCGDGTNDAPALAQADVGVAMNTGTVAAREAGNMVDLDSDPTKLIEVVEIGKQLLMTRGSLTTFSIANDFAKYFAIIPAMFAVIYPKLGMLNVMGLKTPRAPSCRRSSSTR